MKKNLLSLLFLSCAGIVLAQNPLHNCIRLDGVDDHITIPNAIGLYDTPIFTFECWAKRSSSASVSGKDRLMMSTASGGWGVLIENNHVKLTHVGNSERQSMGTISDTAWHHIAVTLNTDSSCFYIDGIRDTCIAYAFTPASGSQPYTIGSRGASEHFSGSIDEVRFWQYIRTPEQIADNRCAEYGGTTIGLGGYFKLNETTGTNVNDDALVPSDGTFSGAPSGDWIASTTPCSATSQMSVENSSTIEMFPNPVQHEITFALENMTAKNLQVEIFDVLGNCLKRVSFQYLERPTMDLTALASGMYIARITGDGGIKTKKFIKE